MGKRQRRRQERLGEKLRQIRLSLSLSQSGMLRHLGVEGDLARGIVSNYELGEREPPLYVLLRYARAAGVCMDDLVDDEVDLPQKLPGGKAHSGAGRPSKKR
jgi:transcriptional regulator with XRE-family HTH domain